MKEKLKKIGHFLWEIPKTARDRMNVPARLYASDIIIKQAEDAAVEQLTNVACLPGVVEYVVGMPDIHWGYGLPMGAVGAFDFEEGIISAGCTGFDINCGIRLIKTNLNASEVVPKIRELINTLFKNVPSGVGATGRLIEPLSYQRFIDSLALYRPGKGNLKGVERRKNRNVYEWIDGWFNSSSSQRVTRGGGWWNDMSHLRSWYRRDDTPTPGFPHYGFRCVLR